PAVELLPVFGSPLNVDGLLDVRGKILPVIDIGKLLRLTSRDLRYSDHLIVLNLKRNELAIRVERATELAQLHYLEKECSDHYWASVSRKVARHNGKVVAELDLDVISQLLLSYQPDKVSDGEGNGWTSNTGN